jgi:hypothetical protein
LTIKAALAGFVKTVAGTLLGAETSSRRDVLHPTTKDVPAAATHTASSRVPHERVRARLDDFMVVLVYIMAGFL